MGQRWRNIVKDYFTFSAKERTGLIIFFAIGLIIYLGSRYISVTKSAPSPNAFRNELASLKITIDSSANNRKNYYDNEDGYNDYHEPKRYEKENKLGELFAFDPNTLDEQGWKRLGLRDRTIQTIQNFVGKGYKFRQPEDLRRIYGLRQDEADRLIPYVRIEGNATPAPSATPYNNPIPTAKPSSENRIRIIEINAADTTSLISLPGIGSKLASRIVNFRDKLGGFTSVNQVAETYGVPDSTFQKIKQRLQCNQSAVRKININTADVNVLKTHPYIKWNIANAIVNYRTQHGNYKTIEDLRKIDIITGDIFNKIAPYLTV